MHLFGSEIVRWYSVNTVQISGWISMRSLQRLPIRQAIAWDIVIHLCSTKNLLRSLLVFLLSIPLTSSTIWSVSYSFLFSPSCACLCVCACMYVVKSGGPAEAEASGRTVCAAAGHHHRGRDHHPGCCGQAWRSPPHTLHQLPRSDT